MYNIVGTAKYWIAISCVLFIGSIVVWFVWGLNLGIDFTGGTSMQIHFENVDSRPSEQEIISALEEIGVQGSHIQTAGEKDYVLRMQYMSNDQRQALLDRFQGSGMSEENFSSIGPVLGSELKRKSFWAIAMVLIAIILFVSYAFRKISKVGVPSWVYGIGAIIALIHDVTLMLGVFIVLGRFFDVQIDTYFVTALLTVLGFSVNDTIVVYDRIREGLKQRATKSFSQIINDSINTTLVRSLNTALASLIVLLAFYLFGGDATQYLILALIFGIIFGTYSSIFIASPLLLLGEKLLKR